jgi:carboxyl-terminal processing protease
MKKIILCILLISVPYISDTEGMLKKVPPKNVHLHQRQSVSGSNNTTWLSAFDDLHTTLRYEYAFTHWKKIDWSALSAEFRPCIQAAEAANDSAVYFLALREYIYSIPDGHMELLPNSQKANNFIERLMQEQIGGSYGLALIGLDDGRVVASIVTDSGPASNAGMQIGAEILEWNGESIESALENIPEIWAYNPGATNEVRRLNQYRFIGRAPVGSTTQVTFKNPGQTTIITKTLSAVDDHFETYWLTHFYPTAEDFEERIQYDILDSGYGYVKVTSEGFSAHTNRSVKDKFLEAIQTFVNHSVPAVILDFRHNAGGTDEVAAYISGFFYDSPALYEHIAYYDRTTLTFEIVNTLLIEPQSPYFGGRVIAMVGPGGISSGEGPPMAIQKLPQGQVISFYASNGSFGMAAGRFNMPCDLSVTYTNGRSLDRDHNIQIDSDANLNGGVHPDIRVPLNQQTMHQAFVEGKDVELLYVIEHLNQLTRVDENGIQDYLPTYLLQNHPNPFNNETIIRFQVPRNQTARLEIVDVLGRQIDVFDITNKESVKWNPKNQSNGIYLYRITTDSRTEIKKMTLLQ